MKRKKHQIIFWGFIPVVFLFFSTQAFALRNPFKDWFPREEKKPETKVEETNIKKETEETFNTASYSLQGVVWGEYKHKAVIGGNIYNVGDFLDKGKITKIGKEGVTIEFNGKEYMLETENRFINRDEGQSILNETEGETKQSNIQTAKEE